MFVAELLSFVMFADEFEIICTKPGSILLKPGSLCICIWQCITAHITELHFFGHVPDFDGIGFIGNYADPLQR
jgi:hypothetical protein